VGYWEAGNGVWGDEAADIMDEALDRIAAIYQRDWQRDPYENELHAGLKFSIGHTDRVAIRQP
jgi:hypothetical protein